MITPTASKCAILAKQVEMYKTLSYTSATSTTALLAGFESLLTLVSMLMILPGRRRLKRTIIVGCTLLVHVELLTSFFCLDERLGHMQIKLHQHDTLELLAAACRVTISPDTTYHTEHTGLSTSLRIAMFVSSVVAGVLFLKFLHMLVDQKAEFDDIADEYRAKMKVTPMPSFHVQQPPNVALRKSIDCELDVIPV